MAMDPETGVADSDNLEADLSQVFVALGEAAKARGAGVALIIDEMQYLSEEELSVEDQGVRFSDAAAGD